MTVGDMLRSHPPLRDQAWVRYRVKDGEKGPMVWEAKSIPIHPKGEDGLPERTYHRIVARNVLAPDEVKYFVSNAPPQTKRTTLLLVAFSRWRVEKSQADYPSSRRWVGDWRIGYHRREGVACTGHVVPAAPGRLHRRNRMSDTTRRPAPPRA